MKRFVGLLMTIVLLMTIAPAPAESESRYSYIVGEIVVRLHPEFAFSPEGQVVSDLVGQEQEIGAMNQVLARNRADTARLLDIGPHTYGITLSPRTNIPALAKQLQAFPAIVFAEPNYIRQAHRIPNDPSLHRQWALPMINTFDAWEVTTGHEEILIAVVDTGVWPDHPDLQGKVRPGYNAMRDNDQSYDDNGHGTAVAGLIAAKTDNYEGIAGVCWNCSILPIKVLNQYGVGKDTDLARGIRWATDQGAQIINMSLGGAENSRVLREAVEYAAGWGVIMVASSGNEYEPQASHHINYPAAFPQVIAVGATNQQDTVTQFSTTGSYLDLTAPGVGVWTTTLDGGYGAPDGTSYSSPFVSGVAGLVLALRGDLRNHDVACILYVSSDDHGPPGPDPQYGWGRINAGRAVETAGTYQTCVLSPLPLSSETLVWEQPRQPLPDAAIAFQPLTEPIPTHQSQAYFPETRHTLSGTFYHFWKTQGGLAVFGYPISEEFFASSDQGTLVVQYLERFRFERPFNQTGIRSVQLSRLGDEVLQLRGENWFTFPHGEEQEGCHYFAETRHSLCGQFLRYWSNLGSHDSHTGITFAESLALFGQPISEPRMEMTDGGTPVLVQWFERARFEDHGSGGVMLGLLGSETARARNWMR